MHGDKHGGKVGSKTGTRDVEVTIDSSILDCPICFGPLQLPFFQCINGHVACSECSTKLVGKCPCCSTTATSRCIPFESLIESCKKKCTYTKSGCLVSLPYNRIATHENECIYATCTCPIPECNFKCQWFLVSFHIGREHAAYKQKKVFKNDEWFSVLVEKEKPYVLQSLVCVYMLLSRRVDLGYSFWIVRLGGSAPRRYELEVESTDGNSLTLKGSTQNARYSYVECCPDLFMYVPPNVLTSTGHLNVKIKMSSDERTCDCEYSTKLS